MLNEAMDQAILVKGWKKGANWSFPRGKINKDEDDLDCAIRELWEETGYDVRAAGLPLDDDHLGEPLDVIMREQHLRFYVFRGVPMDTYFEPKTRKEISKIQWYRLSDLPGSRHQRNLQRINGTSVNVNKFYMVAKFLPMLEKWISKERARQKRRRSGGQHLAVDYQDEMHTEEEAGHDDYNYMSESAPETDYKTAPATILSNVSGTEAALKALLKIAPNAPKSHPTNQILSDKDKGDALLALLRPAAKADVLPQAYGFQTQAPIIPNHHYYQEPSISRSVAAPPPLSTPMNQGQVHNQYRHPQDMPLQGGDIRMPQHDNKTYANALPHYDYVRRDQSQQLLHPQPLPPQVQKAVFAEGLVHSPIISQPQGHSYEQTSHPPFQQSNEFANVHAPILRSQAAQEQPKLTSHTLSLLNAFKAREEPESGHDVLMRKFQEQSLESRAAPFNAQPDINHYGPPLGQGQRASIPPLNDQHKSNLLGMFKSPSAIPAKPILDGHVLNSPPSIETDGATLSGSAQSSKPAHAAHSQTLLQMFKPSPIQNEKAAKPASQDLLNLLKNPSPAIPAPTKHVDGLLDMLKSPASKTSASTVSGFPAASTHSLPAKSRASDLHNATDSYDQISQSARLAHPITILARPAQKVTAETQPVNLIRHDSLQGLELAPQHQNQDAQFRPQILKRPEVQKQPPALASPSFATESPSSFQAMQDRRPSQPAEHKQNLLSLFGKGPSSAQPVSPGLTQNQAYTPTTASMAPEPAARSRVGSLAADSRRASQTQTPLSSADKGFLLGFLNSVTKDGH